MKRSFAPLKRTIRKVSRCIFMQNARAAARLRRKPALIVLVYHEVLGSDKLIVQYPGTGIRIEDFHSHLTWLVRHYPIVRLAEGIKQLRERTLESTSVAITFDDGHIGIQKLAYSVLKELGVPATLFLNACYLDDEQINWLLKVLYLQKKGYTRRICNLFGAPESNLVKWLRLSSGREVYEKLESLDEIYQEVRYPDMPRLYLERGFLWEDGGKFLDIGNHGYRHVKFSWLTYKEQVAEIEKNQVALSEFNNLLSLFAVPFGTLADWNTNTVKACESLGLEFLTAAGGINYVDEQHKEIYRIGADKVRPSAFADWFYTR